MDYKINHLTELINNHIEYEETKHRIDPVMTAHEINMELQGTYEENNKLMR